MKKIAITAILSIVIGLGAGWLIFHPVSESSKVKERKILLYRDPMNPQITSPVPKKSSDGMDFVPVYDESSGKPGERKIAYYKDPMHPWFTSDKPGKAPDCGMDLVPVYEGESDTKGIKIDPVTVQNIGVKVETAERRKLNKIIRTTGKIDFDETKVYSINTKIMGWVEKLYVDYTGKPVRNGEPLLELYSPELVSTQEEYLQALRYRMQLQQSSIAEARTGADQLVESARRRLLYWDISEAEIQELETRGTPKKTMTIFSPVDGIVMEKMVFKGMNVMAGMDLYKIADLSTVWIIADIYQYELPWVKIGQQAEVELSYLPGKAFRGTVTYIYPMLSMETRTAKVRVEVRNTSTLDFKPEMYATVKIASPVAVHAVAVPDQAIIRSGERNVVVVALGGGYFDPRDVKLGVMAEGYVQVLEGIKEGEKIVVSSQFLIDSESNLKAAISQMAGHAGMDMSKPMEESKPAADEHKDHTGPPAKKMPEHSEPNKKQGDQKKLKQNETHRHDQMQESRQREGITSDTVEAEKKGNEKSERVQKVVDSVCGMETEPKNELSFSYNGTKYYFCSADDMEKFKKNPEKYVSHDHQH
jgi:RND family efflux transporter MFP subunit